MCGIAGFAGNGSSDALRRMAEAIRRRGPDDEGFYEAPGVGFAFRRLSIIDVAGGHQPLCNEDGTIWVMMNGEIYGYAAVRDELQRLGHTFTTKTDTEVVVHAYESWGDDCFSHLNGMFAIALWDAKNSRLVLARDRLGKKPLHWTVQQNTLWFCSELKSLLSAGIVKRELDLKAVGLYFRTDAVSTPRTIFQGVSKLEPASALSFKNGAVERQWSFWSCPTDELTGISSTEAVAGLRERLDRAVAERLISDVPLGLFLSGGLDSSVVAESAARQSGTPLKAFTIGFEDATHDERPAARAVATALGIELFEDVLSPEKALGMIGEAVSLLDEPLADASILPQLMLSQFTRQQVTVALSGDGGDELLLGYQHIPAHQWADRLSWIPKNLRRGTASLLSRVPSSSGYFSLGFKAQRFARGFAADNRWARDVAWRGSMDAPTLSNLLLPEVAHEAQVGLAEKIFEERAQEAGPSSLWKAWSWAYLRTYLMDEVMVKVDRATMWYALEGRAPILDTRVVEYLLCLPDSFKLGAWSHKRLFKELLRDRIPQSVIDRPKHGFAVPVAEWLKGPLAGELQTFASLEFLKSQNLFRFESVQRLINEHQAGRIDRRKELWAFFMFQAWYQRWYQ